MDIIYYNEPINEKYLIEVEDTLHEFDTKDEQNQKYSELIKQTNKL